MRPTKNSSGNRGNETAVDPFVGIEQRVNDILDGIEHRVDGWLERHQETLQSMNEVKEGSKTEDPQPLVLGLLDEGDCLALVEIIISISYIASSKSAENLLCYLLGGACLTTISNNFRLDVLQLGIDKLQDRFCKRRSGRLKEKIQQTVFRLIWFVLIISNSNSIDQFLKKIDG